MSCKTYKYKGSELTEQELIKYLSLDKNIVESYKAQEERADLGYESEDRITFERKVSALKRTMNVEVIYDDSIESSRLLGRNDARTKAAGKPVILINPNQLFKTTAIHEFAHVFIDAFPGGLENKRLQRALDQLRDTELWSKTEALYPELSESMLHKEILATAIGREGSEIWSDDDNKSKWESFMSWLSDYLKRALGLERNEIVSLSKELLSNKVKDISVTQIEEIDQQMKEIRIPRDSESKTDSQKEVSEILSNTEKTYNNLVGIVSKIYATQQKSTESGRAREAANVKAGKITRLSSIKDLQETLAKYEKSDKEFAFVRYLNWADGELRYMKTLLDDKIKDGTLTDDSLKKAYNWAASFTVVGEIQDLLVDERKNMSFSEESINSIEKLISEMNGVKKDVDAILLNNARKTYSNLLAKNDTLTEEKYKLGFEKDWDELETEGGSGMQKSEYVLKRMQEENDTIWKAKMAIAEERSKTSLQSLGWLSLQLLSEKDLKSRDIALISNILDGTQSNINRFATEEATNEDVFHQNFKKHAGERNMKKKYKNMFSVTTGGQAYYTSEYNPQFLEDKNELIREAGDEEIYSEKYKDTNVSQQTEQDGSKYFSYTSLLDGSPKSRRLNFSGGAQITVDGFSSLKKGERAMHVSYEMPNGKRNTITLEQAIAKSELNHWKKINIKKKSWTDPKTGLRKEGYRPIDIWKSKEYIELKKDPIRFAELERLMEKNMATDLMYDKQDSIVEEAIKKTPVKFMRIPGVMKTSTSRVLEGQSIKTMTEDALSRMFQVQKDDYDTQTYTDFKDGETMRIPAPYRSRLSPDEQSLDLHTIGLLHSIMGKNYQEKKAVESSLILITEVMEQKQYPVLNGFGEQKIDKQSGLPMTERGIDSNELIKARSVLENRLYGITTKSAGGFKVGEKKIETQQVAKTVLKYFGATALVFNYANSIINTGTGSLSNLMEAIGGDIYTLKDYRKAQKLYTYDIKNIMDDWGKSVQTSRTNLLNNNFNTMGPSHLNNNFEKGGRVEGLIKQNSLRPLANAGEHMMQSKVMYAILESIKVQNDKGQYIDAKGNVVKNKKEAASMNDMITFKKNSKGGQTMVLDEAVQNTSFTIGGGQEAILLETTNLIRSKVDELHGQYTTEIQAHAQRYMLGKLGFFLRKWMISGVLRRYRGGSNAFKPSDAVLADADAFYNHDQKQYKEGYYISAVRFISKIVNDARQDRLSMSKSWKELTPAQKAGVRKTATDIAFMTMTFLAYGLLENADGEIEDEDLFLAYLIRRQRSELRFFNDPMEFYKLAQTPTAATGNLGNIIKTLNYLYPSNWGERYEVGPYKGDLKLTHKAKKLKPRFKNMEDFREALDFINSQNN